MLSQYKLSLPALTADTASSGASLLLKGAQANYGFVPNMFTYMANSPGLLATYFQGHDQFRADSGFSAIEQEVVFLTVAVENGCEYCVSAHSLVADAMSKVPAAFARATRRRIPNWQPFLSLPEQWWPSVVCLREMTSNNSWPWVTPSVKYSK